MALGSLHDGQPKWAGYSPATQKQQRLIMMKVLTTNAKAALAGFTQDVIREGVDKRHETPAAAGNFLKTMKGMFGWGKKMRLVAADPTVGVEAPTYKTEGFPAWTVEDVVAFRSRHAVGTPERLAIELMLLAGLRHRDVALIGRQPINDRVLSIDTAKTGARKAVRQRELREPVRGKIHRGRRDEVSPWPSEVERDAGGAATHQLRAQYGWTNIATAEIYTRGVDRKRLGIEASRIVADQIRNIKNPSP